MSLFTLEIWGDDIYQVARNITSQILSAVQVWASLIIYEQV